MWNTNIDTGENNSHNVLALEIYIGSLNKLPFLICAKKIKSSKTCLLVYSFIHILDGVRVK